MLSPARRPAWPPGRLTPVAIGCHGFVLISYTASRLPVPASDRIFGAQEGCRQRALTLFLNQSCQSRDPLPSSRPQKPLPCSPGLAHPRQRGQRQGGCLTMKRACAPGLCLADPGDSRGKEQQHLLHCCSFHTPCKPPSAQKTAKHHGCLP